MMAKAVANATEANFISMVGSEFVQKYLGEGPRMVRDVFRLARENSPCIIFIDEIDAIATKRFDAQTGADREVQRILLELLNQVRTRYIVDGGERLFCCCCCYGIAGSGGPH
jgi:26S proteasome regulatory subunit T3